MHLEELLSSSQSHNLLYAKEVLNLALEQGDFPPDAYRLAAERLRVTYLALRQGLSRIAPILWEAGSGIFHIAGTEYPGPKTTLKKLAAALSDGKIIT